MSKRGRHAYAHNALSDREFTFTDDRRAAYCHICPPNTKEYVPISDCLRHSKTKKHADCVSRRFSERLTVPVLAAGTIGSELTEPPVPQPGLPPAPPLSPRTLLRSAAERPLTDIGVEGDDESWMLEQEELNMIADYGGASTVEEARRRLAAFEFDDWWPAGMERPAPEVAEGAGEEDADPMRDDDVAAAAEEEDDQVRTGSKERLNRGWRGEGDWSPFPSKSVFLTSLLFNSPRMRFSESQQNAILQWAKDMGADDVPSRWTLEQWMEMGEEMVGQASERHVSHRGNVFYINKIPEAIKKDVSNLMTRQHMRWYPEYRPNAAGEIYHGTKMLWDVADRYVTPMIDHENRHWYINELVRLKSGQYFIPSRWFTQAGDMWAVGYDVEERDDGLFVHGVRRLRPVSTFATSFPELQSQGASSWSFGAASHHFGPLKPNPDRARAQGKPFYSLIYLGWADDVSGNVSKLWNKHYASYISPLNIPRSEVEKEFHTHFIAASQHTDASELLEGMKDSFEACQDGIDAYDALEEVEIVLRPYVGVKAGDNPMQSEECSHIGLKGNHGCRMCHVGGSQAEKQTDEGYAAMFEPGIPRTVEETKAEIRRQIKMATEPAATKSVTEAQRDSGIKDPLAQPVIEHLLAFGIDLVKRGLLRNNRVEFEARMDAEYQRLGGDNIPINPCLDMPGLEVHQDTPVEILHTVLLGIVKYWWAKTWSSLDNKRDKMDLLRTRLKSLLPEGLDLTSYSADYMVQYRNSLIGKHFKTIQQVMPFCVDGLVTDDLLQGWLAIGRLSPLLWETEITDMMAYCSQLKKAINDFLHSAVAYAPDAIVVKLKYHILLHSVEHVPRFGPLVLCSTERYESYNHVFRDASIHSNRQAPSRDIAKVFAQFDTVKHVCTGGYWWCGNRQRWVRASAAVRQAVAASRIHQKWLAVPQPDATFAPGQVVRFPVRPFRDKDNRKRPEAVPFGEMVSYQWIPQALRPPRVVQAEAAEFVYCNQGDKIGKGGFVIIQHEGRSYFGRISAITLLLTTQDGWVTVNLFERNGEHPRLKMPVLVDSHVQRTFQSKEILMRLNVQHYCSDACKPTRQVPKRQEREATTRMETLIEHLDDGRYIINTAILHCAATLRNALQQPLIEITYDVEEQRAFRVTQAQKLRATRAAGQQHQNTTSANPARPADSAAEPSEGVAATGRKRRRTTAVAQAGTSSHASASTSAAQPLPNSMPLNPPPTTLGPPAPQYPSWPSFPQPAPYHAGAVPVMPSQWNSPHGFYPSWPPAAGPSVFPSPSNTPDPRFPYHPYYSMPSQPAHPSHPGPPS